MFIILQHRLGCGHGCGCLCIQPPGCLHQTLVAAVPLMLCVASAIWLLECFLLSHLNARFHQVKMVSSDDEMTTDIIIEGDIEEINRFHTQLNLREKGMVYVKGILET